MSALEKITDWLKLGNKIVIPKTYASCVYDANGETVEARLNNLQQMISGAMEIVRVNYYVTFTSAATGAAGYVDKYYNDMLAA